MGYRDSENIMEACQIALSLLCPANAPPLGNHENNTIICPIIILLCATPESIAIFQLASSQLGEMMVRGTCQRSFDPNKSSSNSLVAGSYFYHFNGYHCLVLSTDRQIELQTQTTTRQSSKTVVHHKSSCPSAAF